MASAAARGAPDHEGQRAPDHLKSGAGDGIRSRDPQIAFARGLKRQVVATGVVDYDGILFSGIWNAERPGRWRIGRYRISEERPLWLQLKLP